MSTPCSVAMKPSTENTTKPAKKLVPLLIIASINASLQKNVKRRMENEKENSDWRCEQKEREPYQYVVTWALCELFKIATGSRKDGEWKGSSNYSESYCCFAVGRYRTERTMTILSLNKYGPLFSCTKYNSIYSLISLIKICSWTSCSYFQCVCIGLIGLGGMVEQCRMYIIKTSKI